MNTKNSFVNKYGRDVFSQNGEDGIIEEAIRRINPPKVACEFGANNGECFSNTANLKGWERQLFDVESTNIHVVIAKITPENVNAYVLQKLGLLSIDIDGNDYIVWRAYKGMVDIVIIEINSGIPLSDYTISEVYGTGYSPMKLLGNEKGYFLLCHTGNMIFILNKHKHLFADADETFAL